MKNNRHFTDALFEEFDYFNDEVDNLLTEDLDTMLKYCNNLQNWDKQELLKFLAKDPTWYENKEQGQYSKWILDKLNRNLLNNSHLGHLHDVLQRFEDNKKHLKNKDINKFKSLQEIDTYLNDENNYNELSHSQIVRQHRRDKQKVDLDNEAELVYEDSDWEIWIPKTYAASCKLGQGSKWCTASTETSSYFKRYSKDGNLYIILNKHNEKEKYQFHFESNSFMDINDKEINLCNTLEAESNKNWVHALRKYDRDIDRQCEDIVNKTKKAREEFNNFSQKINSVDTIKYPTQKDVVEEFKKLRSIEYSSYLTKEDFSKLNKINLEIENSVEKIEHHTFMKNNWIEQIIFEKNSKLKSIDYEAFAVCENIINLELPDSVTEVEPRVFHNCTNLESVKLPNNLSEISSQMFSECKKLKNIIIPSNVISIGDYAFELCKSLKNITIPNSVTIIDNYAFSRCSSLTNIVIPDSVTRIGSGAFYRCTRLTSIEIPNSVTSIGDRVFENCPKLVIKTSNRHVINYCKKNNIKYEKK